MIDSKGHQQAHKMDESKALQKNCDKKYLQEIAKLWEIAKNCGPQFLPPSCIPIVMSCP